MNYCVVLAMALLAVLAVQAEPITTPEPTPSTNATTVAPNTTTSTTTPSTTTTTTSEAPITTTPVPAPVHKNCSEVPKPAAPTLYNFTLDDGNNTCVMGEFKFQFAITYTNSDNKTVTGYYTPVDGTKLHVNRTETGCNWHGDDQGIILYWGNRHYMALQFVSRGGSKYLSNLTAEFEATEAEFPCWFTNKTTEKVMLKFQNLELFNSSLDHSYSCAAQKTNGSATIPSSNVTFAATVEFTAIQLDVFRNRPISDHKYPDQRDCSYVPPTPSPSGGGSSGGLSGAGIALLVLVLAGVATGLTAFWWFRVRNRRMAYQSV